MEQVWNLCLLHYDTVSLPSVLFSIIFSFFAKFFLNFVFLFGDMQSVASLKHHCNECFLILHFLLSTTEYELS